MIIFSDFLKQQQPFIAEYFEAVFSTDVPKLAGAYLLTGGNAVMNYYVALELAKALNCKCGKNLKECNCQDGRWIGQNRHPAVITISPVDFKYDENGRWLDKKSDIIKIEQARYLKTVLSITSDFHRVVIFTGAGEGKEYEKKANNEWAKFKDIIFPPALITDVEEKRESWLPLPLSYKCFREDAANTLLKTIEEPNSKVTFLFLAQDKEDIIETIVSRCCVLKVPSIETGWGKNDIIEQITSNVPINSSSRALEMAETVVAQLKEGTYSIDEFFDGLLQLFGQLIRKNLNDSFKLKTIRGWILKTEQVKVDIKGYVSLHSALEELFLSLVFT